MQIDNEQELLNLLKQYVEQDETNEGGEAEIYNKPWLQLKRDAVKLIRQYEPDFMQGYSTDNSDYI